VELAGEIGAPLDRGGVDVDQIFDAQAPVDEDLDFLDADTIHVRANPLAVVGHRVDHLPIRVGKVGVVFEEVAMPVDVRHHQLLIGQFVRPHQVGKAGIVVDDQFVDFLQAVAVTLRELFVLHAEPPVRVPRRKSAVAGNLIELIGVNEFEDRREEIQPMPARVGLHASLDFGQFRRQGGIKYRSHSTLSRK
jgi:hypothetical protein